MIREVTENKIAQCVQLIRESFLTVAQEFGFTAENAPGFTAFSMTEERLKQQLVEQHRPMYACFAQETLVGFYSLAFHDQQTCELNQLCVRPEYRGKGIGAKLLHHAFQTARALGCQCLRLGIVEENQVLRRWYESFGFVHLGTRKPERLPFTCGFMEKML